MEEMKRRLVESSEEIDNLKVELEALKAVINQVKNDLPKATDTAEIKSSKSATSLVPQQKRKLPDTASYTPVKRRHKNARKSCR